MKNIQVVDGADDCVYDIFAAADEEFGRIFPPGQDVAGRKRSSHSNAHRDRRNSE
jgi:hypothetical protein